MDKEIIKKRWIEAAIILGNDLDAQVLCPVCEKEYLRIIDVTTQDDNPILERHMSCKKCGAYNALRMRGKIKNS